MVSKQQLYKNISILVFHSSLIIHQKNFGQGFRHPCVLTSDKQQLYKKIPILVIHSSLIIHQKKFGQGFRHPCVLTSDKQQLYKKEANLLDLRPKK